MKVTTTALEEVVSGSIHVITGEAAIKAGEEAKKRTHEIQINEAEHISEAIQYITLNRGVF